MRATSYTKSKAIGLAALALVAAIALTLIGGSIVQAHGPSGGSVEDPEDLSPIWLYGEEGDLESLRKFVIEDDDLRGYEWKEAEEGGEPIESEYEIDGIMLSAPDGSLCICEACIYRVLQVALSELWPDEVPVQAAFDITWTHPGACHEKTFKYITGDAGQYHADVPADTDRQNLSLENYRYTFVAIDSDTGEALEDDEGEPLEFETQTLEAAFSGEGFTADEFFQKRNEWVQVGKPSEGDGGLGDEFAPMYNEVRDNFLTMEPDELFDVEEEEEEVPLWPVIFSVAFGLVVVGTTVYSVATGKAGEEH